MKFVRRVTLDGLSAQGYYAVGVAETYEYKKGWEHTQKLFRLTLVDTMKMFNTVLDNKV